jgi:flagellar hook-length control protein FliK
VSHVASETITHAFNHKLPHSARPPQAPDRAQATPFESMLDESAPSTPDRPSALNDDTSRADRSERSQRDARTEDSKAAKSRDDSNPDSKVDSKSDSKPDAKSDTQSADAGKDAKAGTNDTTDKPTDDCKATKDGKADAKTAQQAASIDGSNPVSGDKPADGPIVAAAVVAPAATPAPPGAPPTAPAVETIPTITTADAITTDVAPAPEPAPEPTDDTKSKVKAAPLGDTAAIDANAIDTNAKPKPDKLADLHADADKPADDANFKAKAALQSHADVKPHVTTDEPDKDAVVHARGETSANDNRGTIGQAPGAINAESRATAPNSGIDAGPTAALTAPSHNSAPAATNLVAAAQLAPQAAAIPLAGVAIEIASKALAGKNHFEIRLDPPELGRIEVRLAVDRDGNVTSRLIADRSDTLDLLRRDASGLERALQDAGLKTTDNGLQFSLRDHSTGREQADSGVNTARIVVEDETLSAGNATPRDYGRLAGQGSGIDIHV